MNFPCVWCAAFVDSGQRVCPSCDRSLVIEGYRLDSLLGRGGIGSVYGALGPHGQRIAIKVIALSQGADWKAYELAQQNSQLLQYLSHVGLPKVYGFARSDDGKLFLLRECFDGGTLQERIRAGASLTPSNFRMLLERLLQILKYLHARVPPIYHRDIKPANIMFRSTTSWEPVLVDFDTSSSAEGLRTGNTIVGTIGYTAPEQFAGIVSPASDLYSVGATMLYVATHVEPDAFPKREGKFKVEHLLGNVDENTRALLLQLLEPERQHRPQQAQDALTLLRAEVKTVPALAFHVNFKEEAQKQELGPHRVEGLVLTKLEQTAPANQQVTVRSPDAETDWLFWGFLLAILAVFFLIVLFAAPTHSQSDMIPEARTWQAALDKQKLSDQQEHFITPIEKSDSLSPLPGVAIVGATHLLEGLLLGSTPPLQPDAMPPETPIEQTKGLSKEQINEVMGKANFAVCGSLGVEWVDLQLTITPAGVVSKVKTGDGKPLNRCVARVARRLRFPAFVGVPSMSVSYLISN